MATCKHPRPLVPAPEVAHRDESASLISLSVGVKSPDDVVIVAALRTPSCRAKKGGMKELMPEEMLAIVLKELLERTHIDPQLIDDVVVGNVLQPGAGATTARMASLYAG